MKNIFIFIILTFIRSNPLSAQPDNTCLYSIDPNPDNMYIFDKGHNIWSIDNYIYMMSGFVANSQNGRVDQLFKIDPDTREIIKQFELEGPQGDMVATAYWVTSDKYILLSGEWRDYNSGGIMRMFLMKLTPDLDILWTKYYTDLTDNYLYSEGISETNEGNYMLYVSEGFGPSPHSSGKLRIIRTDTSGAILLTKMLIDTFPHSYGYGGISSTDDGYFLVSSAVVGYYYDPILGTYTENAIVHKVDEDGNQLWSKTVGYSTFRLQEPTITALPGGGGAVMWSKDTITNDPEIAWDFVLMYGFDSNGSQIWTNEWNKVGYETIYKIKSATNSDIIGVGLYSRFEVPNGRAIIFRMSNTGEILWERFYSDSIVRPWAPQLELFDVCELADGRLAATGIVWDTNSIGGINLNVGLLIVDSNGCLEPGCSEQVQFVSSAFEPLFKIPSLQILTITPNPTNGPVQITIPELLLSKTNLKLRCFDSNGQLVKIFDWPDNTATLFLSDLSLNSGIYHCILYSDMWPIANGKFTFSH